MITEEMLEELRKLVRPRLTEKRYAHTLAVEEKVTELGFMFLQQYVYELRAAALLHDITKKDDMETQLQYCKEFGLTVTEAGLYSPKIFHAMTAAAIVKRDFPQYADAHVVDGIRWHTTGHAGMTKFEHLVYLADYIEDTRTFEDCVTLREFFEAQMAKATTDLEKQDALNRTLLLSFDMTIRGLLEENSPIGKDTLDARNELIYKIKQR